MSTLHQTRLERTISLLSLALIFSGLASAQPPQDEQRKKFKDEVRKDYKKWLNCDVHVLFSSFTTHADITAKVAFHGTPMSGVSIVLQKGVPGAIESASSETRKTNSEGVVKFSAVPRGNYTVQVTELLAPTFVSVKVDPDTNESDDIVFEWPTKIHLVQNLRGTLLSADAKKPLGAVLVELVDVRSSRLLGSVHTDASGQYELHAPSKGTYVLRYTPSADESRNHEDIGVSLSDEGSDQLPVMRLESNDCGVFLLWKIKQEMWHSGF